MRCNRQSECTGRKLQLFLLELRGDRIVSLWDIRLINYFSYCKRIVQIRSSSTVQCDLGLILLNYQQMQCHKNKYLTAQLDSKVPVFLCSSIGHCSSANSKTAYTHRILTTGREVKLLHHFFQCQWLPLFGGELELVLSLCGVRPHRVVKTLGFERPSFLKQPWLCYVSCYTTNKS